MTDLRYPVGKWSPSKVIDGATRQRLIAEIEALPAQLGAAVAGLGDERLDTPYRTDGWTPRQIVNHVMDSHLNAYIRFKLAFTEDTPTIKPYNEQTWAETEDGRTAAVSVSLPVIDGLHRRWVQFLRSLEPAAFARTLVHPERGPMTLDDLLQLYAWHGRHHTAHITELKTRQGWT
jgi:uncharacterized damage-inducible protein DinB